MKRSTGGALRATRIASQAGFLVLFVALLVLTGTATGMGIVPADIFFLLDPLVALLHLIAGGPIDTAFYLALIPLALTLIVGRFFCGWVCPLGTAQQVVAWLAQRIAPHREIPLAGTRRIKYVVLGLVVILALLGSHGGAILDPISLLTRSAAIAVLPMVSPAAEVSVGDALPLPPLTRFQVEVVGVLFLALLVAGVVRRRFFCHVICPLGALYGLVARVSPLRFGTNDACVGCGECAKSCASASGPREGHAKQDCTVCLNCVTDCPTDGVRIGFSNADARTPLDLGRREVLGTALSGVFLATLPTLAPASGTRRHAFLRPPGALAEKEFLARCLRCGACIQACPTSFVQAAGFQTGVEGLWTPIVDARSGFCAHHCTRCLDVCPTAAIESFPLEQKQRFKIGTAVIDRNRCFTYADGFDCRVCADACPVAEAIGFREAKVPSYEGVVETVNQIYVDPDLCNGCGACEYVCLRTDAPGIFLTADDEQRERRA